MQKKFVSIAIVLLFSGLLPNAQSASNVYILDSGTVENIDVHHNGNQIEVSIQSRGATFELTVARTLVRGDLTFESQILNQLIDLNGSGAKADFYVSKRLGEYDKIYGLKTEGEPILMNLAATASCE